MIGVIRVQLRRGQLLGVDHLRSIAHDLYPGGDAPSSGGLSQEPKGYIANSESVVYVCSPRNASRASFLWADPQEFEIVIETFYQGHMLNSIEGVVRHLSNRFGELQFEAAIRVAITGSEDAQTYLKGQWRSRSSFLWERMRDDVVGLLVFILLVMISKVFLDQFVQEAIAMVIGGTLLSMWHLYRAMTELNDQGLYWVIHEHR